MAAFPWRLLKGRHGNRNSNKVEPKITFLSGQTGTFPDGFGKLRRLDGGEI
jgi:hypothetical protein